MIFLQGIMTLYRAFRYGILSALAFGLVTWSFPWLFMLGAPIYIVVYFLIRSHVGFQTAVWVTVLSLCSYGLWIGYVVNPWLLGERDSVGVSPGMVIIAMLLWFFFVDAIGWPRMKENAENRKLREWRASEGLNADGVIVREFLKPGETEPRYSLKRKIGPLKRGDIARYL